jgi:hypothetical protein
MAPKTQEQISSDFFGLPDPISNVAGDLKINSLVDKSGLQVNQSLLDFGAGLTTPTAKSVEAPGVFDIMGGGSFREKGASATAGQNFFGYLDKETGQSVGGYGKGIFDLASTLGTGYMQWKQMKNLEKAREQQQAQWMKNYEAQKHMYNQEAQSINAARESRSSGGHRIEQLA